MQQIKFVWDKKKNLTNKRKHKVSFEEAQTVFYDENARLIYDPDHSIEDERFILMGISNRLRILIVCHCYKEKENLIRLISARKANQEEQSQYAEVLI